MSSPPDKPPRPRRLAILSDIHGHLTGLLAAFADLQAQGCDGIVCLGDLVEGGPADEEVVATMRDRGIPCVRGNHDVQHDVVLAAETRAWLAALPERIEEDDALFIHISPRRRQRYVADPVEAWNVFDECPFRLVFVGHVHVPHVFGERNRSFGEARRVPFAYNQPLALEADDRYIISVGSLGYGRDLVGKPRYAILDRVAGTIELRALEAPVLPLDRSFGDSGLFPTYR